MYRPFEEEVYLKLIHSEDSDFILMDDAIVNITINDARADLPNSIVNSHSQDIRLGRPALSRKRLRAALKNINGRRGVNYHLKGSWVIRLLPNASAPILLIGCQRFSGDNLTALFSWLNLPRP